MHILRRRPAPRRIIVQRQTTFTIRTVRVVLAVAHPRPLPIDPATDHTLAGVTVALATCAHRHIGNGKEVRLQHGRVAKHLVAERVQTIQHNANVGGRHPVLQLGAVLEIDGTRTALQRRERHVAVAQRRNVTVLAGAERPRFVFALFDGHKVGQIVGVATRRTVVLVRCPWAVLRCSLVDGERFRSRRRMDDANVGDVEGFACKRIDPE